MHSYTVLVFSEQENPSTQKGYLPKRLLKYQIFGYYSSFLHNILLKNEVNKLRFARVKQSSQIEKIYLNY